LSLEKGNLGVLTFRWVQDCTDTLKCRSKREGPGGVRERGIRIAGFPRNLRGTAVSVPKETGGGRSNKPQVPGHGVPCPRGAKQADAGTVPRSEGNRAGGMAGSGRNAFIAPRKQGNLPEGSLRREGGRREELRPGTFSVGSTDR